jgi:hypothetical protein
MANTIIDSMLPSQGFDYAMGTGWIPYLLGMEELPGKEKFQRASVGTDLFKSLTDFMTNPTAGPLGLAATAAYGGPQAISRGTGGQGLPELAPYQSNFNRLLNDLMGYSGTMNAQPEDTQYVAPPIDPNKAPSPSPEQAAKAPNQAQDLINAWNTYHPNEQKPPVPMKYGGIVEMMLPPIADKSLVKKLPLSEGGITGMQDGGVKALPTGTPTPVPTSSPVPSQAPGAPQYGSITPPKFEGGIGGADPMAAFGGKDLVEAMQRYTSEGGDPNQFIKTLKAISQLSQMVQEGKITPYTGQAPTPGAAPQDFLRMPPGVIKQTLDQYGSQVGMAQGGNGVVVGGQPHFVVDAAGNPVAAITEDGKPEQVSGTQNGFEVTPMDPGRRAEYMQRKSQGGEMAQAMSDAEDMLSRMTAMSPAAVPGVASGGMFPMGKTYVGDSMPSPSGVPAPTIGGPSTSRADQVGPSYAPKTGQGAPTLMEQMASIPGGNYNEQYAKMLGGALSKTNMAIPGEQLQSLNAGRAPDNLFSAQALSTMSPSQRKGYAAMLKQMGIIQSEDDLDYYVDQYRPDGFKKGGSMRLGGGGRFAALRDKLAGQRGVTDPGALAASIGRKKYGSKKMAKMAAKGRKG